MTQLDPYTSSRWLIQAVADSERRDILDALRDAEHLVAILAARFDAACAK